MAFGLEKSRSFYIIAYSQATKQPNVRNEIQLKQYKIKFDRQNGIEANTEKKMIFFATH